MDWDPQHQHSPGSAPWGEKQQSPGVFQCFAHADQVLQPVTARLTSAVPLLGQTAWISGGSGKVLPGEGLSQAWALLMACLQLFPAVGTVWVPVTATGAIRNSVLTCHCQLCLCLLVQVEARVEVAVQGSHAGCGSARGHWISWAEVALWWPPGAGQAQAGSPAGDPAVQGGCVRFCFIRAPDSPSAACWVCVGWGGGLGSAAQAGQAER